MAIQHHEADRPLGPNSCRDSINAFFKGESTMRPTKLAGLEHNCAVGIRRGDEGIADNDGGRGHPRSQETPRICKLVAAMGLVPKFMAAPVGACNMQLEIFAMVS